MFLMFSVRRSSCSSSLRLARSDEDDALTTPPEGRALEYEGEITHSDSEQTRQNQINKSPMRFENKMIDICLPRFPPLVTKLLNPL